MDWCDGLKLVFEHQSTSWMLLFTNQHMCISFLARFCKSWYHILRASLSVTSDWSQIILAYSRNAAVSRSAVSPALCFACDRVPSSWVAEEISFTRTHARNTLVCGHYRDVERGREIHLCKVDKTTAEQEPLLPTLPQSLSLSLHFQSHIIHVVTPCAHARHSHWNFHLHQSQFIESLLLVFPHRRSLKFKGAYTERAMHFGLLLEFVRAVCWGQRR